MIFGNGQQGARLPTGTENVKARYRTGIGRPGNVKAGQISLLEFAASIPVEQTNELQAQFYPADNFLPAQYGVDRYKIRFRSRNELGHWVSIRAELFVPKVDTPTEFPVFVYGAGTTGINTLRIKWSRSSSLTML